MLWRRMLWYFLFGIILLGLTGCWLDFAGFRWSSEPEQVCPEEPVE